MVQVRVEMGSVQFLMGFPPALHQYTVLLHLPIKQHLYLQAQSCDLPYSFPPLQEGYMILGTAVLPAAAAVRQCLKSQLCALEGVQC